MPYTSSTARVRPSKANAHPPRGRRTDGDATRKDLVETAGRLFAQQGYYGTTSKAISESAGTNVAAVNYHFGSRDGLYLAVLNEVYQRILSIEFLTDLLATTRPPAEKLLHFFEQLVQRVVDVEQDGWPVQLWAREILAPSPLLAQCVAESVQPKFEVIAAIVCDLTGMRMADKRLPGLVLSTLAPCLVMLIADRTIESPLQPLFTEQPKKLAERFWRFAMAGLTESRSGAKKRSGA